MVLNADGTACVCDADANFHTASDGACVLCDEAANLISGFVDDVCTCVDNADFDDNGECLCDDGFHDFESACHPCDTESGATFEEGVCSCPADHMMHETSCVACSGMNAELDLVQSLKKTKVF